MAKADIVECVLELRSRGFVCLPLSKGGKHLDFPAMGLDPIHIRSRRKDMKELAFTSVAFAFAQYPPEAATVRHWFEGHDGNIGILGGFADLVILDFDKPSVFERWREKNASLCGSTPVEQTPSGFHVYLKCRTPRLSSSLHMGIRRAGHIKALGGYAVSSPSILKDGSTYRWLRDQSLFDVEPKYVDSVEALSLRPTSRLKQSYDRLLGRGFFEPQ